MLVCFVQDPIHLGVKLKARLLTVSQILPMGKYSAIASHLHLVQVSYSKEHHKLRLKDLDHQDRQNFEAVSRITSPNVLALLDTLPNGKGTKLYLQVVRSIVDSYLDKHLVPLRCIEEAWFAVFFTRYWRQWIVSSEGYNLEYNFISLNSYVYIEINAHALILLLMILRNSSAEQCYCPWLFGSQPCEKAFRAARSMTPTFSTIVNFNILGLLRRLHKLQIQIELESQSNSTGIIYPQQSNQGSDVSDGYSVKDISDFEIEQSVKSALERAKKCMEELGMKDLLQSTENWDKVSFGDVDDVEDNEGEDMLDESVECDKSKTNINKEANIPEESELNAQECKEVVSNLDLMEEKKVIDDGLKQKITYLCQKSLIGMRKALFRCIML